MRRVAMGVAVSVVLIGCGSAGDQRPAVRRAAAAAFGDFGVKARVEGITVHGSTARVRISSPAFGGELPVMLRRVRGRWHLAAPRRHEITIIR